MLLTGDATRSPVLLPAREDERAAVGGNGYVESAIAVEVEREDLRPRAGTVVNQLRHELRAAGSALVAHRPVPIEDGRAIGVGIGIAVFVRPVAFADDEIGDAVTIHVADGGAMQLGKGDAAGVLCP